MAGKKVNRLIVPNVYTANGVEPVTSVNNILPVNGNVTIPIPTVPTNVSAFTNDAGYLTSAMLDGYATQSWVQQQGYLTSVPSQYITDTELSTTLADYVTGSSLSTTLNSYATVTSLGTETSDRIDADDSLQLQINDKYDASNPDGFISGISRSDVTTALGYIPYNSSNPNGYITSAALSDYVTNADLSTTLANYAQTTDIPTVGNGTITINQGGVQKGTFTVNQSGNSTINLDAGGSSGTVDQTYNSTSANAQSGVAIANAKFVRNLTTGTNSVNISGSASSYSFCTSIGVYSQVGNVHCTALGCNTNASGIFSTCIGSNASASASGAIQIGKGTNSTAETLQVGFGDANKNYQLLDGTTGLVPYQRLNGVTDNNSGSLKFWSGTQAEYDAIATKDSNTIYNVEDATSPIISILDSLYPIGAIYIGTMAACPLQTLGIGTWQLVAQDRVLQGAGSRGAVGTTINESLPNITGTASVFYWGAQGASGAFSKSASTGNVRRGDTTTISGAAGWELDASRSSSTYQNGAPVQQDGYLVNIWERIA